jgi:hypothetical protein
LVFSVSCSAAPNPDDRGCPKHGTHTCDHLIIEPITSLS